MENNEVKVDNHEYQHAKQLAISVMSEKEMHPANIANKEEQSEQFVQNFPNTKVMDNFSNMNNLNHNNETKDELSNGIKDMKLNLTETGKHLSKFHFAVNLTSVNLSNNHLTEVPTALLTLKHIVKLNLSHNKIKIFDETPSFVHTLQDLSLANNSLKAPPFWIWKESPKALNNLDISNNESIVRFLTDQEKYEILKSTLTVDNIVLNNCCIHMFREILLTLVDVKELSIGYYDYSVLNINKIDEFPCDYLECYNVEKLHLSHVALYTINESINYYTSLTYLDLSSNCLSDLPTNFGDLVLLEICKLSYNKLLYLPDTLLNLKKLKALYVDNNGLYILPENLLSLPEFKCVDVYNNNLESILPELHNQLDEVDFAQNYFSEPEDPVYIEKKAKLRNNLGVEGRFHGKRESNSVESEHSQSDNESDYSLPDEQDEKTDPGPLNIESEEDWDSDSYWEPSFINRYYIEKKSPWAEFMKKKMMEGNFCPADLHEPSIIDKINYIRSLYPQPPFIPVEGQFDDMSDDDS